MEKPKASKGMKNRKNHIREQKVTITDLDRTDQQCHKWNNGEKLQARSSCRDGESQYNDEEYKNGKALGIPQNKTGRAKSKNSKRSRI